MVTDRALLRRCRHAAKDRGWLVIMERDGSGFELVDGWQYTSERSLSLTELVSRLGL